jgi:hypothetical protein
VQLSKAEEPVDRPYTFKTYPILYGLIYLSAE